MGPPKAYWMNDVRHSATNPGIESGIDLEMSCTILTKLIFRYLKPPARKAKPVFSIDIEWIDSGGLPIEYEYENVILVTVEEVNLRSNTHPT